MRVHGARGLHIVVNLTLLIEKLVNDNFQQALQVRNLGEYLFHFDKISYQSR